MEDGLDLYLELHTGFYPPSGYKKDYVLHLVKNISGTKQAPRVCGQRLKQGLEKIGMKQSQVDPCIFYNEKVVACVYVDDIYAFAKSQSDLQLFHKDLQKQGFIVASEGSVAQYVGVNVTRQQKQVSLTQPVLINKILEALNIDSKEQRSTRYRTPADCILRSRK